MFMTHNQVVAGSSHAPFGDPMVSQHVGTGSFNSAFRFNAKEYDEETGNYYYGATEREGTEPSEILYFTVVMSF